MIRNWMPVPCKFQIVI